MSFTAEEEAALERIRHDAWNTPINYAYGLLKGFVWSHVFPPAKPWQNSGRSEMEGE